MINKKKWNLIMKLKSLELEGGGVGGGCLSLRSQSYIRVTEESRWPSFSGLHFSSRKNVFYLTALLGSQICGA